MPRPDDDFDDDDRPRRRRPRDDNEDDDGPRRRRRDDDDGPPPRTKSNTGLVIGIVVGVFVVCCGGGGVGAFFLLRGAKDQVQKAVQVAQDAQEAEASRGNMTRIGLAIHNYHDAQAVLPNNTYDPQGRPLLSWRVHILPYLNEGALHGRFNLNEPWDSPTNRPLVAQMPRVYSSPGVARAGPAGKTFYRGFSHRGAIFEKPQGAGPPARIGFQHVMDGLTNTILLVDAGEAIEWTRPDDLDWSPGRPRPALGGGYPDLPFTMVLLGDGSVRRLKKDVNDTTLRHLIDRQDGNAIPPGWEQ